MIRNIVLTYAKDRLQYDDLRLGLLDHGMDILENDGTNYLCVFLIGILFKDPAASAVFIISFSLLRYFTGGWHAKTRLMCFLCYQSMFIFSFIVYRFFQTDTVNLILYLLMSIRTMIHSPVIHPLNPLSHEEIMYNQKMTKKSAVFLICVYLILYHVRSPYCMMLFMTMTLNTVCMTALHNSPERNNVYEN